MNNKKVPKLQNLVEIYYANQSSINLLNMLKGYKHRTMQQMNAEEKNSFIEKFGLELFTYYLVHADEEVIELMPHLSHYQRNEELLKWLVYNGSGNFAYMELEYLNQELEECKRSYAKLSKAKAEKERKYVI